MATVNQLSGSQGLDIRVIRLDDNETATIRFAAKRMASVPWGDGGVSWTITPANVAENVYSVDVEHSLAKDGGYWVPDLISPVTQPSDGAEEYRQERLRFRNTGHSVDVVVSSAAKFTVDLS
ncbi:hypothetical protein [Candidatus Poriferisocius sp.]|uniref:hypothetical protein n=1 Tax=Candidatus Poriferisocius sp. TaxID=3101276 RepID=UPI003B02C3AE